MRECRICLDSAYPETMVSPCRCKGTAEYIHEDCLREYFFYFPDGLCRVCHKKMRHLPLPIMQIMSGSMLLLWILTLLYISEAPISSKITYACLFSSFLIFHIFNSLLTPRVVITIIILCGLFTIIEKHFMVQIIFIVSIFCIVYTLFQYIPPFYLLILASVLVVGIYIALLATIFAANGDKIMTAFFMCTAFLAWNLATVFHPPMRLE